MLDKTTSTIMTTKVENLWYISQVYNCHNRERHIAFDSMAASKTQLTFAPMWKICKIDINSYLHRIFVQKINFSS